MSFIYPIVILHLIFQLHVKGSIGNEQTSAIDYTPKLSIEFGYEREVYYFNNEYE